MDRNKGPGVVGKIKRFCERFAQGAGTALGKVVPRHCLLQWIQEEAGNYRERVYAPLQILQLFIEQVLEADQSCQDAVACGMSQRVEALYIEMLKRETPSGQIWAMVRE